MVFDHDPVQSGHSSKSFFHVAFFLFAVQFDFMHLEDLPLVPWQMAVD